MSPLSRGLARDIHLPAVGFLSVTKWLMMLTFVVSMPASAQTVQLTNLTRPFSSNFYVGEAWQINVTGDPNRVVSVYGTQNGVPLGTTPVGSTDGSGNFTLTGSMPPEVVGSWMEIWYVDGIAASPTLFFEVQGEPPEPCSVDISPNPLTIFSFDYWAFGSYQFSSFGSGSQSGEGEPPFCAIGGIQWFNTVFLEGSPSFPSLYEGELEWEDVPGSPRPGYFDYPVFTGSGAYYIGVDLRDGTPFIGTGFVDLVISRVDLF